MKIQLHRMLPLCKIVQISVYNTWDVFRDVLFKLTIGSIDLFDQVEGNTIKWQFCIC